jgi:hypothetical protein
MKRLAAAAMAGGIVALMAVPSFAAAPVEGCDGRVLQTMQAAAQSRVAASKAVDDEIYTQPDSGLALTCFNQAASVSAQQAGATFSGDFRAQTAPVVDDALKAMYSNFGSFSVGGKAAQVDYTSDAAVKIDQTTTAPITYNCNQISKLWNTVNSQGVNTGTPYMTQSQLLDPTYTPPDGGSMHNASLASAASTAARTDAANAAAAMPDPVTYPIPSCRGPAYNTPCKVMACRGIGGTVASMHVCMGSVCRDIPTLTPMTCP